MSVSLGVSREYFKISHDVTRVYIKNSFENLPIHEIFGLSGCLANLKNAERKSNEIKYKIYLPRL